MNSSGEIRPGSAKQDIDTPFNQLDDAEQDDLNDPNLAQFGASNNYLEESENPMKDDPSVTLSGMQNQQLKN